ncbi:hypothetical protein SAMN02910456_02293 [Ruminococcaceae bacterium YRB3002]|nr:hypothetical protein SAMN02910456_02293 [Ruminococcaceae bacterium YRB3002]
MKTRENDKLLESTFREEYEKIPPFLRLNRKTFTVAGVLVGIAVIFAIVLICVAVQDSDKGMLYGFESMINLTSIITMLIICISPVGLWFAYCYYREKKAFKKASDFAAMHARWQEEKIHDRYADYQYRTDKPEDSKPKADADLFEPRVCRRCGNVQFDMSDKCSECGTDMDID